MRRSDVPSLNDWLVTIGFVGLMSKLSAICGYKARQKNAIVRFRKQWEPFLRFKYLGFHDVKGCEYMLAVL